MRHKHVKGPIESPAGPFQWFFRLEHGEEQNWAGFGRHSSLRPIFSHPLGAALRKRWFRIFPKELRRYPLDAPNANAI
jgi:hypothetical protein